MEQMLASSRAEIGLRKQCVGAVAVQFKGSLRAVHGGDVRGTQLLAPLLAQPGLVAIGPMAQLDGEITAVDGKLYVSKVKAVKDHADLDNEIEQAARRTGVDTSQPFPFKLIAAADHKSHAMNLKLSGHESTLVGFYSSKHEGVFTHRGSRVHSHVID
jgi:acetolactate decarboxylase